VPLTSNGLRAAPLLYCRSTRNRFTSLMGTCRSQASFQYKSQALFQEKREGRQCAYRNASRQTCHWKEDIPLFYFFLPKPEYNSRTRLGLEVSNPDPQNQDLTVKSNCVTVTVESNMLSTMYVRKARFQLLPAAQLLDRQRPTATDINFLSCI
jgi:hypothetical protein